MANGKVRTGKTTVKPAGSGTPYITSEELAQLERENNAKRMAELQAELQADIPTGEELAPQRFGAGGAGGASYAPVTTEQKIRQSLGVEMAPEKSIPGPRRPRIEMETDWQRPPPFPQPDEQGTPYATEEEKADAALQGGSPIEFQQGQRSYGFAPGTQFQGIPPEYRPDTGFYDPHYPSKLREAIDLGIVSLEDGRRLYAEYDKFKNSPEGIMLEAKRMEDFAKGEQGRFGKDVSDIEAENLDRVASQWEDYGQKARRLESERRAFLEGYRENYDNQITSYKMAMDDLRRTHRPQKSWGDKLMAGIAVALGALGSAVSKTPNYALQILMKNVDTEMAQYDADLKRGKNLVYMESNLLGQMRARMKSEDAAYDATRQFLIQDTINRIKSVSASSDSAVVRKKADAAIAGLSAQLQVENKRIQAKLSGAAKQAAMIAALGARRSAAAKAQREAMGGFMPIDKSDEIIFGGEIGDWAISKADTNLNATEYKDLRKAVSNIQTEIGVGNELLNFISGTSIPTDPASIYKMKQLSTMMLKAMITERGANLTDLEVRLLRAMSGGDPGSLPFHAFKTVQPQMISGVKKFIKWRQDTAKNALRTAGGRQVQTKRFLTEEGRARTMMKEMPETWVVQPKVEFQSQ